MPRRRFILSWILLLLIPWGAPWAFSAGMAWAYEVTGEENPLARLRGVLHYLTNPLRPALQLASDGSIPYTDDPPFGVNTFLEQEVEPEKRERTVRMIAEAGFRWIRQEFPWADIEIHRKGDFEDRRHIPYRSAWEKYDHIVDLAGRYGLRLIVRLTSPPAWSRHDGEARGAFAPPDNPEDFADFAEVVARRYRGRVFHYQIWNEPNIAPEWGSCPTCAVDPEAYTDLLCRAYRRLKAVDPRIVVIAGALAPTLSLNPYPPNGINDVVFLERMYRAGAGACFDALSVQGYGLWSGPTDRRLRPYVININRALYIRDVMVRHGDAHKPIYIAEMGWNAVPDEVGDKRFGQVTEEQKARYLVEAFERIRREWPWVAVANVWFFKRASDRERNQSFYYFSIVEPDFTPLPAYEALKAYLRQPPRMDPGAHTAAHWALRWEGPWSESGEGVRRGLPGARVGWTFYGGRLRLEGTSEAGGRLRVEIDGGPPRFFALNAGSWSVELPLAVGVHAARVTVEAGPVALARIRVGRGGETLPPALGLGWLALVIGWALRRNARSRLQDRM
ncbi:cellulase family glycosylhydrolase [Thermoflexus sp.]|uniref:cellulase family glycosylhydrolase n=1 Tax=Thermoflexus sp. TaxID=1969742 RepID=UPI001765A7B3|nr:cellulase family glycosylhydrolase [Thermoflexus sp.]